MASRRPPRLVLRFALFAALALVLAVLAGLLFARAQANERAQQRVLDAANAIATRLGHDDLARTAFTWPPLAGARDQRAFLDDVLELELLGTDVRRVTLFSPNGRVTYSSDRSLVGKVAQDGGKVQRALGHATAGGTSYIGDERVIESYVPVHWALAPATPRGVLAVARDYGPVAAEVRQDFLVQAGAITLALLVLYLALLPIMRRVTRSLRASEASFRALMEQSSDGIVVFDAEGTVLQANHAFSDLTGRRHAELPETPLHAVFVPDDVAQTPLRLPELLAGETVLQERRLLRADGSEALVEVHASLLEDGRIQASVRDLTERRRVERELREAQKAEALGKLAAGAADDFGAVLAQVAAALADGDVQETLAATKRGARLVRQLHSFAERPVSSPEVMDLNSLLEGALHRLRRHLGGAIELHLAPGEQLHPVRADPEQIEQVVLDLALSARDSMPRGGSLTIATGNVDFARRGNGRSQGAHGEFAMLSFSDTAEAADTSERFGLGLATALVVVQQSGGTIGVETTPGAGTTVRVYLPRAAGIATPV
jgi:PAS domain S-box-containing protein